MPWVFGVLKPVLLMFKSLSSRDESHHAAFWNECVDGGIGGGNEGREDRASFDRDLVPVALLDLLNEAVVAQQA